MYKVLSGLDILTSELQEQKQIRGNIAYLGHQASVNGKLQNGLDLIVPIFGKRVSKAFGPQHGFSTSAQDNMIETPHAIHPAYKIPIYSLYSETREPTDDMMDKVDTLIVDLQDVGTRVYTYIWSLYHSMQYAEGRAIEVVVLDRPNPLGGLNIQGNLPDPEYYSFVCRSKIPMRHGLTIGEMALWFKKHHFPDVSLRIIKMKGWKRKMLWRNTNLDWVNPSPNLPTPGGCLIYPGTVLIEGTNLSEGRGTTRSLELFGHPNINPFLIKKDLDSYLAKVGIEAFELRPTYFEPVFHKFSGLSCGGFQIHLTNYHKANSWKLVQFLLSFFYQRIGNEGFWCTKPYEYEFDGLAIDWINGTDKIRKQIENNTLEMELLELEKEGMDEFKELRKEVLMYN